MSDVAIRVAGLGKQYHLGAARPGYSTLRDQLRHLTTSSLRALLRRGPNSESTPSFWALKDVSFEVKQGDVVGILGRNGAGKSTLLKILSRITEPTTGETSIRGRVGSLLEVGTGFHPELTGRENVFLNGAILGMSRAEIKRRFDEIVAFAEVEKFIDTPVKHFSSGMYMRLAFAVAAHLEPEILIVDEVLAVGDAGFQKKCLGKMSDVAKHGRTVLFVSHNVAAMSALCNRGVLLEQGTVSSIGSIGSVVSLYLPDNVVGTNHSWEGVAGNDSLRLRSTAIETRDPEGIFHTAAELVVSAEIEVLQPIVGLVFGIRLRSGYGAELVYSLIDDAESSAPPTIAPGRYFGSWRIPADVLAAGNYSVAFDLGIHNQSIAVVNNEGTLGFQLENRVGIGKRFVVTPRPNYDSLLRPNWSEGMRRC